MAIPTFSAAVRVGMRLNCWKTNPISSLRIRVRLLSEAEPISLPSKRMVPLVGVSRAPSSCSSVLFPDPLGPSIDTNSPGWMSRSTSWRARTGVLPRM